MGSPLSGNIVFLDRGIVYPDSDGKPMADNTLQALWNMLLFSNLRALFASETCFVAADHFWYPVEGDPKTRVAPDVMVVFGRPDGHRGSYKQWMEEGIPPHVVIEVLFPSNTAVEMIQKLAFYEKYGASEFIILDPEKHKFEAHIRKGEKLVPAQIKNETWTSPSLGITFKIVDGELETFHSDGTPLKSLEEVQAEKEILQAEKEAIKAERNAAQAEIERLKARLRELGENPE